MTLNDIVRLNIRTILKSRGYYKNKRLTLPMDMKYAPILPYRSIIKGSGGMTLNTLETVAHALDVEVAELIRWENK